MIRYVFSKAKYLFKFKPITVNFSKRGSNKVFLKSISLFTTITSFFAIKHEDIEIALKRAIISQMQGNIEIAEKYFHDAIKLYEDQSEDKKEAIHKTNLFLHLANFYYENKDLNRSFRLYQECLRDLLVNFNYDQNSEAVIEISLKMSNIFAEQGNVHEAKVGYEFCLQAALSRLKHYEHNEDKLNEIFNIKVLYSMISQSYGRYLCHLKDYKYALLLLEQARIIIMQLYENQKDESICSSHVSSLLNDLAVSQYGLQKYSDAIETFKWSLDYIEKENHDIDVKESIETKKKNESRVRQVDAEYEMEKLKEKRSKLNEYKIISLANMCQSHFALNQIDFAKNTCTQAFNLIIGDEKLKCVLEKEMNEIKKTLKEIKNITQ